MPNLPMVKAIAPNAPIGAAFMTMAITPNTACAASSMKARSRVAALAEAHQRKAEQDREQQHLQDFAAARMRRPRVSGMMCRKKSTDFCASACLA